MLEQNNESLKEQSRTWWSQHSQDYVAEDQSSHTGARLTISDEDFLAYLADMDKNFAEQAYFAQRRGEMLFSELIPTHELKGKRVLEVGCGLGSHCEVLARSGAEVEAVDLSPVSVAVTKRRLQLKGLSAHVQVSDAESLPFANNSFDYVWSWGVIHHSPNTKKCAEEITRVLEPGGQLGIMLYHKNSLYNWINVIFRYGILQAKLLKMSVAELHNRYTDGKHLGGAPLAKYYSRSQVKKLLFPDLLVQHQMAYEQKKAASFWVPARYRRAFEKRIPDTLYNLLFARLGFMLFTQAKKPD